MTETIVGYARTSTADQKAGLEAQLRDLQAAGCTKVFKEEVSSVDKTNRKDLERAEEKLNAYQIEAESVDVTAEAQALLGRRPCPPS